MVTGERPSEEEGLQHYQRLPTEGLPGVGLRVPGPALPADKPNVVVRHLFGFEGGVATGPWYSHRLLLWVVPSFLGPGLAPRAVILRPPVSLGVCHCH